MKLIILVKYDEYEGNVYNRLGKILLQEDRNPLHCTTMVYSKNDF